MMMLTCVKTLPPLSNFSKTSRDTIKTLLLTLAVQIARTRQSRTWIKNRLGDSLNAAPWQRRHPELGLILAMVIRFCNAGDAGLFNEW